MQAEYTQTLSSDEGRPIHYENEKWDTLIDEAESFLLAVSNKLKGHDVNGPDDFDDYIGIVFVDE